VKSNYYKKEYCQVSGNFDVRKIRKRSPTTVARITNVGFKNAELFSIVVIPNCGPGKISTSFYIRNKKKEIT
jgi:hypothetical protein